MGRSSDWSILGMSEDPTPGRPGEVAVLARHFATTAQAVSEAVDGLRAIHTDGDTYTGKGGTKIRDHTRDLSAQVAKIQDRYQVAGEALHTYHQEQHAAQIQADAALARAEEAASTVAGLAWRIDEMERSAAVSVTPDPARDQAIHAARSQRTFAEGEILKAKKAAQSARQRQHDAAIAAANKLKKVLKSDGLNDRFRDDVAGVAKVIADVAGAIAAIAGILALVFAWVPILGQVLAAIALVATLVSLLANLTMMLCGKGSWSAIAWDVLSVATLGLGRAARLAAVASKGRAWQALSSMSHARRGARVVTLLGGRLHGATNAIRRVNPWGLTREGLKAFNPMHSIRGIRTSEFRQAMSTFSGGSFKRVTMSYLTGGNKDFAFMLNIDDIAKEAAFVRRSMQITTGLTVASSATLGLDTYHQIDLLIDGIKGSPLAPTPDVTIEATGPGLPAGFQAPPEHMAPIPPLR